MKKILNIKWENIIGILLSIFCASCIISHITENGFQFEVVGFEIIVYALILSLVYVSILSLRRDLLEMEKNKNE